MALIICEECKKEFSSTAKSCPHCGAKKPPSEIERVGGGFIKIVLVIIALFWAWGEIAGNSTPASQTTGRQSAAQPVAANLPADEQAFIATVNKYRDSFKASPNEMAAGGLRHQRKTELCKLLSALHIRNWAGTIKQLSSNNDGKGVLTIQVSDNITISTSNNAFSDSLLPKHTLIEPDSTLFQTVSSMTGVNNVTFTGNFFRSDSDCFLEQSMTLNGTMTEPEFLFVFSSVEKR